MLSNIQITIDILRQSHIKKGEEIDTLIRQFQELNYRISQLSQQMDESLLCKQLSKLTNKQMIIIGSFLEFKQFARLRLVNKLFRNLVQSCFHDLKITFQNKLNIIQLELAGLQDNNGLTNEQIQQRLYQLQKKRHYLNEVSSFVRSPHFLAFYVIILGQKKEQNHIFNDMPHIKKFDLLENLQNIKVETLNSYQLSMLDQMIQKVQQRQNVSLAVSYFLNFLLGIKEFTQSPSFIRKRQSRKLQQIIKILDKY